MRGSVMLKTDSYKVTHWRQYPPGTPGVYSYLESRGGQLPDVRLLRPPVPSPRVRRRPRRHPLGNRRGGRLLLSALRGPHPLQPRGMGVCPPGPRRAATGPDPGRARGDAGDRNVLMTVENTDPLGLADQLPGNAARAGLVPHHGGHAVARDEAHLACPRTHRRPFPDRLQAARLRLSGRPSVESAALGGAAHLVNFKGTDTIAGCELARRYYHAEMPGFSIPAAEHSTITAWGRERELDAYANMLAPTQTPRWSRWCRTRTTSSTPSPSSGAGACTTR